MAYRRTGFIQQEISGLHFRCSYVLACSTEVSLRSDLIITFLSQNYICIISLIQVSEINYLCVHKKLRSKRLAPVLIKEVTRQCHLKGVFQAIYTAGVVIPTPISICRYYHRSLNIPKLVDTRFYYVPRDMTLARLKRLHKLPTATSLKGLREMEEKDIVIVTDLFTRYMTRFEMVPICTVEELRHQLLSGMGEGKMGSGGVGRRTGQVTWSYVVEVNFTLSLMIISCRFVLQGS